MKLFGAFVFVVTKLLTILLTSIIVIAIMHGITDSITDLTVHYESGFFATCWKICCWAWVILWGVTQINKRLAVMEKEELEAHIATRHGDVGTSEW